MRFTLPLTTFFFLSLLQVTLPDRVLADPTPQLLEPNGGESFVIGSSVTVRWVIPYPEFESELAFSADGGAHFNYVADHLTGDSYVWHPSAATLHGLLRVAHSNTWAGYGTDTSDAEFVVHGEVEHVRFALHRKNPERYPTVLCDDPFTSTIEPNYGPNYDHIPCSQYTVNAPLGGSTVYLVLGQADPAEGVSGASFGIQYTGTSGGNGFPPSGISPRWVTFTSCAAGNYTDDGGFPGPGGGLRMWWGYPSPEACQREVIGSEGVHAVVGSFYVYAYSSALFRVTPNTSLYCCGPELGVASCVGIDNSSVAMTNLLDLFTLQEIDPFLGRVQFGTGTGGYTPCSAGAICSIGATDIDVKPNNLNLNSGAKFVSASIELPSGYDPADVPVGTVKLNGSVEATELTLGDFNHNGVSDFTVKFLRQEVEYILPEGDQVQVTITGSVGDNCKFAGTEAVKVLRPHVVHPNGGESYAPGATALVEWTNPNGWSVDHAQIHYSADGGDTWAMVADQVTGESYSWAVPQEATQNGRIRVVLFDAQGVMGYDTSDGPFTVSTATTGLPETIPMRHRLYQNSPNPFRGATRVTFDLPEEGKVTLKVFDLNGRVVRVLADEWYPAGKHEVPWNALDAGGKSVSAGMYFLHIAAGSFTDAKRMYLQR
jgi:hypothetical protein